MSSIVQIGDTKHEVHTEVALLINLIAKEREALYYLLDKCITAMKEDERDTMDELVKEVSPFLDGVIPETPSLQ